MKKLSTGEPYAGEPHVRFGRRGGKTSLPYFLNFPVVTNLSIGSLRSKFPVAALKNLAFVSALGN
jgi:hypothetical protein